MIYYKKSPSLYNKADELSLYRFAMSLMINFKHHKLQAKNSLMICYDNNEISWYRPHVNTDSNTSSRYSKFQLGSREITKSLYFEKTHLKMLRNVFQIILTYIWKVTTIYQFFKSSEFSRFFQDPKRHFSFLFQFFNRKNIWNVWKIYCKARE